MGTAARSTYGQAVEVNFDWSWCPPAPPERPVDLRVALGTLGRFEGAVPSAYASVRVRPARDASGPPLVRVARAADGHHRITYADGAEFVVDETATEVFGVSRGALTLEDLLVYLQGPVLGFVLRLRGVTCLHASAAVVGGRAFALVGRGGIGKSTAAAIFARRGLPVLTDDVLALVDRGTTFDVQPGLPRVLLWSESVRELYGDPDALPRIVGTWDKRYLDLTRPGYAFGAAPAPLAAIYVLSERLEPAAAPSIDRAFGAAAMVALLANTYANDLIDRELRARELGVLARVAAHVPVRVVRAPDDRGRVNDVCDAILADFSALSDAGGAP
jgi:hypothetical protein